MNDAERRGETAAAPYYERLAPFLVFSAVILVFLPALKNHFVNLDDDKQILACVMCRGLGWANLRWMFATFYQGTYMPLSWLSYALTYEIWGLSPFGYHLVNVLLHAANAVLVYFLSLRLLKAALPKTKGAALASGAAFAALFFALHPLRVESVAWASERRDVLSGFFYLLALIFYLKAQSRPAGPSPSKKWLAAAFVSFALSLLAKGIGITLPGALILLDIYPLGRLDWRVRSWLSPRRRAVLAEKIPFFALSLAIGAAGYFAQGSAVASLRAYGLSARTAQSSFGVLYYLRKTLIPVRLLPFYPIPAGIGLLRPPFAWDFLLVMGITCGVVLGRRRWKSGPVLWAFYVLTLSPVLGLARFGNLLVAGRYSYLACLGWAVFSGGCLACAFNAYSASLALGLLVALGGLTWKQTQVWRDSQTLWRYTLSYDPSIAAARMNLGTALMDAGRLGPAALELGRAAALAPRDYDVRFDFGNALSKEGKTGAALRQYRAALALAPRSAGPYLGMGAALYDANRFVESREMFAAALKILPDNLIALVDSGNDCIREGRPGESLAFYRRALKAAPDSAAVYNDLGYALAMESRYQEALRYFNRALQIDPSSAGARQNRAKLLQIENHGR
ncbi:MAG TPA: tetratricopeptide repeat protein [Elusimicrobiota bacterium]|nr:tetratricopeptide repeat protein [Elusimicrobiota bacterium]